jgi:quercetin dioxygenase-like cupin family protein
VRRSIRLESLSDNKAVNWFGSRLWFPVRYADTGGRLCVQLAHIPLAGSSPPHCHGSEDEVFYVLAGGLELETPHDRVALMPGDLATAPRGLPHRVSSMVANTRVLTIISPESLEEAFFRVAADPSAEHLRAEMDVWGVHTLNQMGPYLHTLAPDPAPLRVVRSGEGDRYWLASDEYTIKVASSTLDQRLCVVHFRIPPGGGPVVHTHTADEEVFHVIRGSVCFYVDGTVVAGKAGDTAVLPRGIPHCFRNTGDVDAEFLAIVTPAGFDEFVRLAGTPAVPGQTIPDADDAELARLGELSARFGVRLHPEITW